MPYTVTVHIAAAPEGWKQKCLRCDCTLIDHTGTKSIGLDGNTIPHHFWPTNGFVGKTLFESEALKLTTPITFLLPRDASENDEVKCLIGS